LTGTARLMHAGICGLLLACAAAFAPMARAAHDASGAEYAFRWNPADGGPKSAEKVAAVLGLDPGRHKSYEVRYFAVAQPVGLAEGASVIVRQRSGAKGATETMFKVRGTKPFDRADPLAGWQCPFPGDVRAGRKAEVDVGWTADGSTRRTYSLSCEADGDVATLMPAGFKAAPLACSSKVRRTEVGDLKIERWALPDGSVSIEVSWEAGDSAADLEAFRKRVVAPLVASGARAQQASKTELGSGC